MADDATEAYAAVLAELAWLSAEYDEWQAAEMERRNAERMKDAALLCPLCGEVVPDYPKHRDPFGQLVYDCPYGCREYGFAPTQHGAACTFERCRGCMGYRPTRSDDGGRPYCGACGCSAETHPSATAESRYDV